MPPPAPKPPKPVVKPCVYRSHEPIDSTACVPCKNGGLTQLPVYSCDIHGRCITNGDGKGIKHVCLTCMDRTEEEPASEHVDVLCIVHHDWQVRERICGAPGIPELLASEGLTCDAVTRKTPMRTLSRRSPRVVLNWAFCWDVDRVSKAAARHPETQFVNTCHSSPSHVVQQGPDLTRKLADFIRLAKSTENVWIASPDPRMPQVCDRQLWLPNTRRLPDMPDPSAPRSPDRAEAPIVSLCCRRDAAKNIGNQIVAAALVNETRPIRLRLRIKGQSDDLVKLAESLGLDCQAFNWLDRDHFARWLSTDVDVGLQCSHDETFGYVALEHMLYGLPVVCSPAVTFCPQWLVAPSTEPYAIADRLRAALEATPEQREDLHRVAADLCDRNGREFVAAIQRVASAYLQSGE